MGKSITFEEAFKILDELAGKSKNMSLDDIVEKYSPIIDAIIKKHQKQNLTFSAGKFKIAQINNTAFTIGFELYFQDDENNWIKAAKTSDALSAADWLSDVAWQELQNVKEKIYDVEAPK